MSEPEYEYKRDENGDAIVTQKRELTAREKVAWIDEQIADYDELIAQANAQLAQYQSNRQRFIDERARVVAAAQPPGR